MTDDVRSSPEIRILLVEDRENWRKAMCELLFDLGYDVREATCGEEFRRAALDAHVIIMDISMPMTRGSGESKTTGLEVLMELQAANPHHPGIQHPIVRSMWERQDFAQTGYEGAKIDPDHWVSRNTPLVDLLDLIERASSRQAANRC